VDIIVPEGAVPAGTEVHATLSDRAPAPAPNGFAIVGQVLSVTPHGTTFSKPITIHMPAPAAGGTVQTLADDADRIWEPVSGVERGSGTLTFSVSHISFFAVLTSSHDAGPSGPDTSTSGPDTSTPKPTCGHIAATTTPIFDLIGAAGPASSVGVAGVGSVSADGSTVFGGVSDSATKTHAFRWTKARGMETLVGANGPYEFAGVTNCDGTVFTAAYSSLTDSGLFRARTFRVGPNGAVPILGLPELPNAGAVVMSDDGNVLVGSCQYDGGGPDGTACVWRGESATLSTIPGLYQGVPHSAADGNFVVPTRKDGFGTGVSADGSVIGGVFTENTYFHGFRYTEAKGLEVLDYACSSTALLSADGQTMAIEGCATDSTGAGTIRSYRWTETGGRSELCPTSFCNAVLLSGDGNLFYGYDQDSSGYFFWDSKHGVRDAHALLAAAGVDFTKWVTLSLGAMTPDKRVFIGTAYDAAGNTSAFRLVLPEGAFD
jgi:hypothetical protein